MPKEINYNDIVLEDKLTMPREKFENNRKTKHNIENKRVNFTKKLQ